MIGRLDAKGWVRRLEDPHDKRRKLLWISGEGEQIALKMKPAVAKAQLRIMGPLQPDERMQLAGLLEKLVGKTLGIQIITSRKARLLRTLFGAILALMRLNFLSFYQFRS